MSHTILEFEAYLRERFLGDPRLELCRGAAQEDIVKLIAYADRPLPRLYLDYLRVFGEHDGPLELGDDCSCSVSKVLSYRKSYEAKSTAIQPLNAFRFTNEGVSLGRSFLYREGQAEPRVVVNDLDVVVETLADSFEVFLFRRVWKKSLLSRMDFWLDCSLRGHGVVSLKAVVELAKERGFRPLWFSDTRSLCAEKDGVCLFTQFQGATIFAFFYSSSRAAAKEECDVFQKELGYTNQQELGRR